MEDKEKYKRIWFILWIGGGLLMFFSFVIALNPKDNYFILIGILFLFIHIIGLFKYVKPLNHR